MNGWLEKLRAGLKGTVPFGAPGREETGGEGTGGEGDSEVPLIVSGRMDVAFRQVCAVYADGVCLIARGYLLDPVLRDALVGLRQDGAIPEALAEREVSLEAVAAAWAAAPGPARAARGVKAKLGRILAEAAAARASDVILRRDGEVCRVMAIVNDRMVPLRELSGAEGTEAMMLLFHAKDEGTAQRSYQRTDFQGFAIRPGGAVPLPAGVSGLRCERGPHEPDGDHLYARIFYRDSLEAGTTLEELGLTAEQAAVFAEVRRDLKGGVFIGGSTGDGKSTTLAVNLSLQAAEFAGELNMVTLEDPVEYPVPGAVQIAVATAGDAAARHAHYRKALMHFCRVHPATGMVSEIRDAEGARQVLQFVDTGHQVWTTIHVANANGILFRLMDLGVSPAEVAKPGNVALLAKQTLAPLLCGNCARATPVSSATPEDALPDWLGRRLASYPGARFRDPAGCAACRREAGPAARAWNGYAGLRAVMELIRPDEGYLEQVRRQDPIAARRYWIEALGGEPLERSLDALVGAGRVDPFDALTKGALLSPPKDAPPVAAVNGAAGTMKGGAGNSQGVNGHGGDYAGSVVADGVRLGRGAPADAGLGRGAAD